jgi:hypothetical protein
MQLESAAGRLKGFEIFLNKRAGFEWLEWKTDETRSKSRQKNAEIGVFGRFGAKPLTPRSKMLRSAPSAGRFRWFRV